MTDAVPNTNVQRSRAKGTVVIADGETDSTEFIMGGRSAVLIHVPTITSAALTFKVKVSAQDSLTVLTDKSGDTVTWATSTGAFTRLEPLLSGYYSFQIISDGAQGAERTFYVTAVGENATPVISDIEVNIEGATTVTANQGTKTATLSNAWPVALYAADGSVLAYQGGEVMAANTWGVSTVGRASSSAPSAVTTGDAVKPWHDLGGAYIFNPPSINNSDNVSISSGSFVHPGGNSNFLGVIMKATNSATADASTRDNWRNNVAGTLLASAARTTTTSSADQTNYNGQAVAVTLNITAVPGGDTVTLSIEAKDPVSGAYTAILTGSAEAGTATRRYRVGTNIAAVANLAAADVLGRTWRATVTHSAAGSFTYSVGYDVMTA